MGTLFASTLRALVREKSLFIWSLAFPILMATIFMFMFANLDGAMEFDPVPTGVVTDEAWDASPFSAVAEALGMEVSWDAAKGAVVSYGEKMIKPAPLTTNVLFTAMPGGEILGVDGDGETYETYGTCVKENGVTYLSLHTLANLLDLFIAD